MITDTKAYCKTCMIYKCSKPSNQKPYGLLNPLLIPGHLWEFIGVDFVGLLPESTNQNGLFDSITVVICLLTSMVHLTPSQINYNACQIAELMFEKVYKHHGIPKNIISDHDILFMSVFWTHLHQLLVLSSKCQVLTIYRPMD